MKCTRLACLLSFASLFIHLMFDQIYQVVLPLGIAAPVGLAGFGLGAALQVPLSGPEIKDFLAFSLFNF